MAAIIQHYVKLTLLKAAPQDMPASAVLQILLVLFYFILALINTSSVNNISHSLLQSVVDLVMLFIFTYVLLQNNKSRINQTYKFIYREVGLVIGVIHTLSIVVIPIDQDPQNISTIAQIIFFLVFLWVIVVYANIIRHATDSNMAVACAISLIYIILNVMVLVSLSEYLKA